MWRAGVQPGPVTQLLPPALGFPQPRLPGLKKEAIVLTSWPHPTPSPERRPPPQRAGEEGAAGLQCPGVPGGDKEHQGSGCFSGWGQRWGIPSPREWPGVHGPLLQTRLCLDQRGELLGPAAATQPCPFPPGVHLGSTQAWGWFLLPQRGVSSEAFSPMACLLTPSLGPSLPPPLTAPSRPGAQGPL